MATRSGTINFWLRHEHKDWWSNTAGYTFDEINEGGVKVAAIKHPDKTLELSFAGALGRTFEFRVKIPKCEERGLMVMITWTPLAVTLYLNGTEVETRELAARTGDSPESDA